MRTVEPKRMRLRVMVKSVEIGLGVVFCATLLGACATTQTHPASTVPPQLAFEHVRYDGNTLKGRLLVEAQGPTVLDRRLLEYVSVGLTYVRDSDTGRPIEPWVTAIVQSGPKRDERIILQQGEWFGRDLFFLLSAERSPDKQARCIDFELQLLPLETGAQGPVATAASHICRELPEVKPPSAVPHEDAAGPAKQEGGVPPKSP
jgi:hypothetical protein